MLNYRFDWPPSVNNYWGHRGSKRYVKKRAKDFRGSVVGVVEEDGTPNLKTRLAVHVELHPPNRRKFDIDNYLKPLIDAMEAAGIFEDDAQIDRIIVERLPVDPAGNGCVDVTVLEDPKKVPNKYDEASAKSDLDRRSRLIEFFLQNKDRENARAVSMGNPHLSTNEIEKLNDPLRPSTRWLSEVYSRRLVVAQKAGCGRTQIDAIIGEAIREMESTPEEIGSVLLGDLPDFDSELDDWFATVNARGWSVADLVSMDSETARILQAKNGRLWRLFQVALGACDMRKPVSTAASESVRKAGSSDHKLPFLDIERLEGEAALQAMRVCGQVGHAAARVCNVTESRFKTIMRRTARRTKKPKPAHLLRS